MRCYYRSYMIVTAAALTVLGSSGITIAGFLDEVAKHDPTNRYSDSPIHIITPFRKPGLNGQVNSPSGLTVISYRVNADGSVDEQTRTDLGYHRINSRATLKHYPSGRAYWEWAGKQYYADPRYDNLALQQAARIAAERAAAESLRQNAIATLREQNQTVLDRSVEELRLAAASVKDQELDQALTMMIGIIQQAQALGLNNVDGFSRFKTILLDEARRRVAQQPVAPDASKQPPHFAPNLGIQYESALLEKQHWGLKVVEPPANGSPGASIGLEVGDIVLQLDGQFLDSEKDVENHFDETSVLIRNVRDGSTLVRNVTLPPMQKGKLVARYAYSGGAFEQHSGKSPTHWTETKSDSNASFSFEESRRNNDHIFLLDRSRGITIRLPIIGGASYISTDSEKTWRPLYQISTPSVFK